jgi:hypothetical protein
MNYYQRNFYAFVVSEGPLMIIENKLTSSSIGGSAFYSSDRQAGMCPIVINAPTSLDMDFIMQNVLGSIIDLLFTEQEANAMLNPEKLPHAVEFHYIGKVTPISIDVCS